MEAGHAQKKQCCSVLQFLKRWQLTMRLCLRDSTSLPPRLSNIPANPSLPPPTYNFLLSHGFPVWMGKERDSTWVWNGKYQGARRVSASTLQLGVKTSLVRETWQWRETSARLHVMLPIATAPPIYPLSILGHLVSQFGAGCRMRRQPILLLISNRWWLSMDHLLNCCWTTLQHIGRQQLRSLSRREIYLWYSSCCLHPLAPVVMVS